MQEIKIVKMVRLIDLDLVASIKLNDEIRENIKQKCLEQNISIRQLAVQTNGVISYSTLNHLLIGKNDVITINKFLSICEILKIDPVELLHPSIKFICNSS